MEKHSQSAETKNARTRRHKGGFVSLCLIAALALVVGTGLFGQRFDSVHSDIENTSVTNLSEAVAEIHHAPEAEADSFEVASDPDYGSYEKGKVLIAVDGTTDLSQLNAALSKSDLIQTKDVSDQDMSAGFVQVTVKSDVSMKQMLASLRSEGLQAQPNYVYHTVADESEADVSAVLAEADADAEGAKALEGQGVQPSDAVHVNDPGVARQWGMDSLDVYRAWGIAKCKEDAFTSPKVSVAVIDTGCAVTHEDLVNNIRATYNSSTCQPGVNQVSDANGHGTHVAGIIAADANNGKGVAGVSYDAGLVIIKATTDEAGKNFTTATLAQAYTWLLTSTGAQTNAQAHNVRVVNMSVGGEGTIEKDDLLYKKITEAKNANILTVCAAGNQQGDSIPPYDCIPGDYEDCFTVINLQGDSSAVPNDSSGSSFVQRASGSNYNVASGALSRAKNISAPGTGIYSTVTSGGYGYMSGTSMASPAVAGVAALLFAYDPNLSVEDARALLEQTATDIGDEGWDAETGYGEADAYHALQMLSAKVSMEVVSEEPTALVLRGADDSEIDASEWLWETSDPSIFIVDNDEGTIEAIKSGFATLKATHKKITGRTISQTVRAEIAAPTTSVTDKTDISRLDVTIQNETYTGQAICPKVSLPGLTQGTDYTVSYKNNINAGTAYVTFTATADGRAIGAKTVPFMILRKSLADANVTATVNSSPSYTGQVFIPSVTVQYNGKLLTQNQDFTVVCTDTQAGDAWVTLKASGPNFTGEKRVKFIIKPQSLTSDKVRISNIENKTYNGSVQKQTKLLVKYDGRALRLNTDYTVTYRDMKTQEIVEPRAVGDYELVITGKGNYADSVVRTYVIKSTTGGNQTNNSGNSSNSSSSNGTSSSNNDSGTSAIAAPKAPAVTGAWKKSNGKWWFQYDAKSQKAQNSRKNYPVNEWVSIKGKRYHFDTKGYMSTKWYRSSGYWYYLGSDGAMKTGWQKNGSKWYYLASNGIMQTGRKHLGGKVYYLDRSSGAMKTGWNKEGSIWYRYGSSGAMLKGWTKVGKKWYYLNPSSGVMKTYWLDLGGQRYFLHPSSGEMLVGWAKIDNKWYYFNKSGAMQKNKWVGNYYVESDGVMAKNKWIGKYHVNASGKWDSTRS